MKVAVAGFHIESVSFLPTIVEYEIFERDILRGREIIDAHNENNTVVGGYIQACEANDIEIIPLVYAWQGALGPASDESVVRYAAEIADALKNSAANVDGVLLHLHGAAVTPNLTDPEALIIQVVRDAIGSTRPIMVSFDYHGNIGERTLQNADAAFAYHCSPHTDMRETGNRTADCMARMLREELNPVVVLEKPGVMVPSICSATALHPLADILARARQLEKASSAYLDISVMAGFSYSDSCNAGFSVIAVSDNQIVAKHAAQELCSSIWQRRQDLYKAVPLMTVDEALDEVETRLPDSSKPFVMVEHADRMNNSTYLLDKILGRQLRKTYVPFLWDPDAAQAAVEGGAGATIKLQLGAHTGEKSGPRLTVTAKVLTIGPQQYTVSGPIFTGTQVFIGHSALLAINGVLVSVVSHPFMTLDTDPFFLFGLQVSDFDIIVLRSKTHFRKVFEPLAEEILIVDTPDYGTADLTQLPYQHISKQSVYPLSESQCNLETIVAEAQ